MSGVLRALRNLFGRSATPRKLSFEQARVIANAVPHARDKQLEMVAMTLDNGRPTWTVSTSTIGHGWFVIVDDETATAGPLVERHGR